MRAKLNEFKQLLLQQDGAPSHIAKHHQILSERKVIFTQPTMWPLASNQSRLERGRLCSVGSPAAASILR